MRSLCFILLAMTLAGPFAQGYPLYYEFSDHEKAQGEARQRNLPLAWLGGNPSFISMTGSQPGSQSDLQNMAMATLKDNSVILFFDGSKIGFVPWLVHAQFHIHDDGELSGGASWIEPKVVFTDPEVTQILGRVSETDMKREGAAALNSALQIIRNNPKSLALPSAAPSDASSSLSPLRTTKKVYRVVFPLPGEFSILSDSMVFTWPSLSSS